MRTRLFLTAGMLAFFACNSQTVDDSATTAKLKAKLAGDSQTSAIKIDVATDRGIVTLSGTVPTETERARADELARNTEGVKRVVNDIKIDPNSIGATNIGQKLGEARREAAGALSDDAILAKLKSKLLVAGITGTDIHVTNGQVLLKGQVKNPEEKVEAESITKNTEGVVKVTSELSVKKG
jgi:hyperosmotically inducible protein